MTVPHEAIDSEAVTHWFETHVPDVRAPLSFDLITGGRSNLTYSVRDQGDGHWVLRRPPLGSVLATAHDMSREHRLMSALAPTAVPVPPIVGLCTDETVNGAPFYVMDFVDGVVVRDPHTAAQFTVDQRHRAGESLIENLVAIHAVDVDQVGLGDLSRRDGYIARQLRRWNEQLQASGTRDLPLMDEVFDLLSAAIPEQGPPTIVHGDYRLDNCMLGPDGSVVAVLDWEICTLGDPLADMGLLLVYWSDPGKPTRSGLPSATDFEGFPNSAELVTRYEELSGRDLSDIDYYVAFGYWKLACILEGVHARYVAGVMGDGDDATTKFFADQVISLAEDARQAIGRFE